MLVNAGVWGLWELGWVQPVLKQAVCYVFFILVAGIPVFACLLPLLLFIGRIIMKVDKSVCAIEEHLFGAAASVYDKVDDVTDMLGITELSDSDLEEEAAKGQTVPESERSGRNMFNCGCAATPAPTPAVVAKKGSGG